MPNLRIRISGLCFFAFDQPLKGEKVPTRAALLLQKLNRARTLNNVVNRRNEVLDPHFPMLQFNLLDRHAASTRGTDFLAQPDRNGKMAEGVCLLFGDDVRIKTDDPTVEEKLHLDRTPLQNPVGPTLAAGEEGSLFWVPTLEDAFPGYGAIDERFVKNHPGANEAILARVHLTQGQLRTVQITDQPSRFVPPGSPAFHQRVAKALALDIPFREKVTIDLERREDGKVSRSQLVLVPSGGADLEIEIKNLEIDELIGVKKAYSPRLVADFEIYADLLLKRGPGAPAFLRQTSPGNPAGVGLSECPPGAN